MLVFWVFFFYYESILYVNSPGKSADKDTEGGY